MLLKLFGQSFLGSISYAITQWLIISSIGHILTIKDTGIYATALGIVVTVNMFFNFGIRQITYSTESDDVLSLSKYVLGLQLCGLALVIAICSFFYPDLVFISIALYLYKIIETLTEYQYGIYQRNDLHNKIAISRTLRSICYTGIFITCLYFTRNISLASFFMFFTNFISFILIDKFNIKNKFNFTFSSVYKIYLSCGFPLAITAALLSFRTTAPRFFVENEMSYSDVGILVSYLYLVNAGGMIVQSWSQVISPKISREYNNNNIKMTFEIFIKGAAFIILYCVAFNIAFIFCGEKVVKVVYGDELYFSSGLSFSIIVFMYATYLSSYIGYCVSGVREFKIQPKIFTFLLFVSLFLVYIATNLQDLVAVIYSLAITAFLQFIILLYIFIRKMNISFLTQKYEHE